MPSLLSPSRAALVPIFSFGENDMFDQIENSPGSWLRWFQEQILKIVGASIPLFYGRGVFQYSFGLMPYCRPINTVGKPRSRLGGVGLQGKGLGLGLKGNGNGPDTSLSSWSSGSILGNGHIGK